MSYKSKARPQYPKQGRKILKSNHKCEKPHIQILRLPAFFSGIVLLQDPTCVYIYVCVCVTRSKPHHHNTQSRTTRSEKITTARNHISKSCGSACTSHTFFVRDSILFQHATCKSKCKLKDLYLCTVFPKQLLSWMGFSILARNGLCSLMICWLLLVPAGVLLLVSLLLSSFFLQERGSVPWWFAGSSWFWLGFRCLSPFFFLLSFLRKGVLFHHDLLVPLAFGWGSGACLPSPFFLSSGKGFCSIMICWFFLVPAGVPVLVSLLLSSFFHQESGSVPWWFAGSSCSRLGFRCLSPFFSLLSFLRKGVLFHHDLLVPLGFGWGSGASLPSSLFFGSGACLPSSLFFLSSGKGVCSIMMCWFFLVPAGVPGACLPSSPFFLSQERGLFHHDLLVPPVSGWGSGACLPSSPLFLSSGKGFCSMMICWFLLVLAGVPVLVSLLLSSLVPVLVSRLLSSFVFQKRGSVPSWFAGSSWFRLGFRSLSPFFSFPSSGKGFCSIMICWFLLVPAGVPVLVSLFSLFFGSGACIPSSVFCLSSGKGFCSMMICWYLLVLAGCLPSSLLLGSGPVPFSLLLPSFFPQERGSVPSWFAGSSGFRLGFRCLSPFFSLLSFLTKGVLFHDDLLVPLGSGWGSGACLPSSLLFGSGACLPSSLFFPGLLFHHDFLVLPGSGWGSGACLPSSLFFLSSGKGFCSIMICWFFLVPAGVPVLVSLLLSSFFPHERGSVPSWFAGSSWFRLGFRCLSPFFSLLSFLTKGILFHHDLLLPLAPGWGSGACLPSSLFFGSGACLPSSPFFLSSGQGFCSIMICWFLLVPAGVLVLVSLLLSSFFPQQRGSVPSWFAGSSCSRLGFRCLSPFFSFLSFLRKGVLFHHDLLVPLGFGWGSGASLPSSLFFGSGACLPSSLFFLSSGKGFCSIMICWFLLVPAGVPVLVSLLLSSLVPVLVSLLLSSFFPQEMDSVPSWFEQPSAR